MGWKDCGKENMLGKCEQLCWSCTKCTGGCSWSSDFIPVKNWIAEEEVYCTFPTRREISYKVFACPEFEKNIG